MRSVLVLWDIDYTLISAGGVGPYLYGLVFRDLFGADLAAVAPMAGRTERAIIRDTLAAAGIDDPQRYVAQFLAALTARAPALVDLVAQRGRALPGAAAVLAELARHAPRPAALASTASAALAGTAEPAAGTAIVTGPGPADHPVPQAGDHPVPQAGGHPVPQAGDHPVPQAGEMAVVQSVLTGNVRPLAEVKLAPFGLASYLDLDVGAYGDHHEVRAELVHLARGNATHAYGHDFSGQATVLVGDTPLDVAAALAAGARAVGVGSGASAIADLAAAGAHAVLPDLTDTAASVAAILGQPR